MVSAHPSHNWNPSNGDISPHMNGLITILQHAKRLPMSRPWQIDCIYNVVNPMP
jgi:hypothetical protein